MTPLYAGIHAADRRKLPASLLGELWRGSCSDCGAPVVCHRPSLDRHKRFWFLQAFELRIVCPTYCDSRLAETGGVELMEITADVGRHFCKG